MKKISTIISTFTLLVVVFAGCKKYEPTGDGAWNDSKATLAQAIPTQVVYEKIGNLYTYNPTYKTINQIARLNYDLTNIALSPKYDKIAYKVSGANIVVIDMQGNVLQTIANSSAIEYFEWYHDNNLLYGVPSNIATAVKPIKLYGTSDLPPNLPNAILLGTTTAKQLDFYYITKDNDVFYGGKSNYVPKLGYIQSGQTTDQKTATYNAGNDRYNHFKIGNYATTALCYNTPYNSQEMIELRNRSFWQVPGSQNDTRQSLELFKPNTNTSFGFIIIYTSGAIYINDASTAENFSLDTDGGGAITPFDYK